VYFIEGHYQVEVVRVFTMRSRKKDDLFIVECKILESDNAERRQGMRASWVVNLKQEPALGNIKGFVAAANGIDPADEKQVNAEVTEEVVEFACGDDNPLEGTIMELECVAITTRAGNPFTLHKWQAAEAA
jgi:hypothetical protein